MRPGCTPVNGVCEGCGLPWTEGLVWRRCDRPMRCAHQGAPKRGVKSGCKCGLAYAAAAACDLYGRCLPTFSPQGEDLATWQARDEAAIYTLCALCPSRVLVATSS